MQWSEYSAPERGKNALDGFYLSFFGSWLRETKEILFGLNCRNHTYWVLPCLQDQTNAGSYCKPSRLVELCTPRQCLCSVSCGQFVCFSHSLCNSYTFHGPVCFTCFCPIHQPALCIEAHCVVCSQGFVRHYLGTGSPVSIALYKWHLELKYVYSQDHCLRNFRDSDDMIEWWNSDERFLQKFGEH